MVTQKVELNIPGTFKGEPLFYQIIKNFEVIPRILEASFSTEMGWAIVEFEGKERELQKLYAFLKEKGVELTFY